MRFAVEKWFGRALVSAFLGLSFLCALRIYGYYHPDEFGQITAFYLYKLGYVQATDLPWEFHEGMRPWLQPAFYTLILAPLSALLGFRHLLFERIVLLVGFLLLALVLPLFLRLVLAGLKGDAERSGDDEARTDWPTRLFLVFMATLWFVPNMLVRHSSEAFATVLMVPALYLWMIAGKATAAEGSADDRRRFLLLLGAGFFAGLSAWIRFQIGVFWAAFFLLALGRDLFAGDDRSVAARLAGNLGRYGSAFAGIVLALVLALLIDRWGYGTWQFAPWNYYHHNIVRDASSKFGVEPWHWYFKQATDYMITPFFLLILGRAIFVARGHALLMPVSGGLIAFFALHSAVPHKEIRFLLPMILPAALLLFHLQMRPRAVSDGATRRWWVRAQTLHWSLCIAVSLIAFAFTYYTRGIREKYQISQTLWQVPPGTRVYSLSFAFGHLDENHEPDLEIPGGWMEPWVRPPVRFVFLRPARHAAACREHPDAIVLHSMNEKIPAEWAARLEEPPPSGLLVDLPFPVMSRFPTLWLRRRYPAIYKDHWRYHLVRCPDYLNFLEDPRSAPD